MTLTPPVQASTDELAGVARDLRLDVLDMTVRAGGHLSSCYSAVEIMVSLYFGGVLRYRPDDPTWVERDRFFLSKGHAAPLLYAVLARAGYFPHAKLEEFRGRNSQLYGHPIEGALPGIENTSGSLGHGVSFAIGHLHAARLRSLDYRCFVLLGDGECQEGQIWEAAMFAGHHGLKNLVAIIDFNGVQQNGPLQSILGLGDLADKWRSFGWSAFECDGHDLDDVTATLRACDAEDRPSVVIAHTVKGKGISFVEADHTFHGRQLTAEQASVAREELWK